MGNDKNNNNANGNGDGDGDCNNDSYGDDNANVDFVFNNGDGNEDDINEDVAKEGWDIVDEGGA